MKKATAVLTFIFLVTINGSGQEDRQWRFSIGVNNRAFSDIEFRRQDLSAPGGNFTNGSYTDDGNYTILHGSQLQPGGWQFDNGLGLFVRNVSFDRTSFSGDEESDDADGLTIELERIVGYPASPIEVGLFLGLSYFDSEVTMTATPGAGINTATLTGMLTSPADPGAGQPATPSFVTGNAGFPLSTPQNFGDTTTTRTVLQLDADLRLLVLSLGARARYKLGPFALTAAAGPTLNVSEFSSRSLATATSLADGSTIYSTAVNDDTDDFMFGAFLELGGAYQVSERWDFGVTYRYDILADEVDTKIAETELNGHSGQASISFRF